jgi:hypothetical protein
MEVKINPKRRLISDEPPRILHTHRCENLKSYKHKIEEYYLQGVWRRVICQSLPKFRMNVLQA